METTTEFHNEVEDGSSVFAVVRKFLEVEEAYDALRQPFFRTHAEVLDSEIEDLWATMTERYQTLSEELD